MKHIVICCDGTMAKFDVRVKNTSVLRLYEWLLDNSDRATFYQPGIGTRGRVRGFIQDQGASLAEAARGVGLQGKVETVYRYLMDVYAPGHRVYLFGCSRWAYTVRLLAEMLDKCGLLTKGSQRLMPYASQMFRMRDSERNYQIARDFRRSKSRECRVHILGVWDTVASIGFTTMRRYYRKQPLPPNIRHAYHAPAIDERRKQFLVARWNEDNISEGQSVEQV